jgi:hypothetical protein
MARLGYQRYVSQGGDWGSVISNVMARQAPAGLAGIHVNMPATVPPEIAKASGAATRRRPGSGMRKGLPTSRWLPLTGSAPGTPR